MTKERLEELKNLCDAATPGPWHRGGCSGRMILMDGYSEWGCGGDIADVDTSCNSEFISVSRTVLPELITAYEKAVGMLKRIEWTGYGVCPMCDEHYDDGHAPDCELKKILEVK